MSRNYKILICFNEPVNYYDNYTGKSAENSGTTDLSESEFFTHLNKIESILKNHFGNVKQLAIGNDFYKNIDAIENFAPNAIFNFVESVEGKAEYEVFVAGMFDILGIQYTGNTGLTLANCLDKNRAKRILSSHNIITPQHLIIDSETNMNSIGDKLDFPFILKLNKEDASIGISEHSVVYSLTEFKERVTFLLENYKQSVIAEKYIDGREFNISILNENVLPISEINFEGLPGELPKIVTYEAKWLPDTVYYEHTTPVCPALIDDNLKDLLTDVGYSAFYAMDCRDYARVDIRLDSNNIPYVIEVNPNPDISVDSGFVRAANAARITYENLILDIADLALERKIFYDTEITEE